jgi:hypothetical protein
MALVGVLFAVLTINLINAFLSTSPLRWASIWIGIPLAASAFSIALVTLIVCLFKRR